MPHLKRIGNLIRTYELLCFTPEEAVRAKRRLEVEIDFVRKIPYITDNRRAMREFR